MFAYRNDILFENSAKVQQFHSLAEITPLLFTVVLCRCGSLPSLSTLSLYHDLDLHQKIEIFLPFALRSVPFLAVRFGSLSFPVPILYNIGKNTKKSLFFGLGSTKNHGKKPFFSLGMGVVFLHTDFKIKLPLNPHPNTPPTPHFPPKSPLNTPLYQ